MDFDLELRSATEKPIFGVAIGNRQDATDNGDAISNAEQQTTQTDLERMKPIGPETGHLRTAPPQRHSFGTRRFDIALSSRSNGGPDNAGHRWVPAGFDAFTWLRLDPEQFQISGNQVAAAGAEKRNSDDEQDWNGADIRSGPDQTSFDARATLQAKISPNWRWQTRHVRVLYQDREWLLNEKAVSEVLTILKATQAIPARVIGYREGQRVQRTDRLYGGDTLDISRFRVTFKSVRRPQVLKSVVNRREWENSSDTRSGNNFRSRILNTGSGSDQSKYR
jgi:hypothetical protein